MLERKMIVIDLKSTLCYGHSNVNQQEGVTIVYWKNYFLSNNGFLTHA